MGWEESSARAKRLHRPSLRDWERDGLYSSFPAYASNVLDGDLGPYNYFGIVGGGDGNGKLAVMEWSLTAEEARRHGRRDMMRRRDEDRDVGPPGGGTAVGGVEGGGRYERGEVGREMYPVVLDASLLSPREFHERYESRRIPVVIRGILDGMDDGGGDAACRRDHDNDDGGEEKKECHGDRRQGRRRPDDDNYGDDRTSPYANATNAISTTRPRAWPAMRNWSIPSLLTDPLLSGVKFKVGEDDDGNTVRMRLRHFLRYLHDNRDDSPLYIFDATFDECKRARRLLDDYDVPRYFDEDLFKLVGERRRPPYRWFLVGPQRSGTTVHVDPLSTSAWNAVVHGVKRWVLFPPHVPRDVARGRGLVLRGEDDEAVHYFTVILPRMKRRAAAAAAAAAVRGGDNDVGGVEGGGRRNSRDPYANFECYEFTQYPGETVYVPHGWWHAVLNITHTVGITQNYCSRRNFDDVWRATRRGRKKMACKWLRRLEEVHPDLAKRARLLNDADGHVMWEDDPEEQRRWRKKREERERRRKERERKNGKVREEKEEEEEEDNEDDDDDEEERRKKSKSKREKWGDHRTAERRGLGG
ncbi:hypothetical protein ACHAXA_010060 [Cyclostephanos tholiformis]|uniref:JmjC domain-containing protein n=1 Tax=Cyclostephanos tholiformis TaxID=382380 RepID=A0ABD3SF36_9STRA